MSRRPPGLRASEVIRARERAGFFVARTFENYYLSITMPLREGVGELAGVAADALGEVLLTEYSPGAGIGRHRDAPMFGVVAGVSLLGACRFRFERGKGPERVTRALTLAPRSAYLLTGETRALWSHSIPPTKERRYSVTFRTLRPQSRR